MPRDQSNSLEADSPASDKLSHPLLSLLLIIHCFCVAVVLSANLNASALQRNLVSKLRPYTRTLNFDPNFTRYHITNGEPEDDDHVVVVVENDAVEQPVKQFPGVDWRGGERYKRFQALAAAIGHHANSEAAEADSINGELARSVGANVMRETGLKRVVVRCQTHRAQPMELRTPGLVNPTDPNDELYFQTVYEADVWIADDGSVQVVKKSARREVAPTRSREKN